MNNMMEYFNYKGGCGVQAFKRRAGLSYRQIALGY